MRINKTKLIKNDKKEPSLSPINKITNDKLLSYKTLFYRR